MRAFALIILVPVAVGCSKIDKALDMPEKMDNMQEQLLETNESVRLQKIGIAKENLEKPENAVILQPIPFGLMAWAKVFAENATTEEISAQTYLYLKEINSAVHGTANNPNGIPEKYTAEEAAAINQREMHRYTISQSIAGLMPDAVTAQLIKDQIDVDGRYKNTALSILMMRFSFIRDVLLKSSLLSDDTTDVGSVEKAVEYVSSMDTIARLPYVSSIKVSAQYLPPIGVYEESLDAESAKAYMLEMLETISTRALAFQQKSTSMSQEQNQRMKSAVNTINTKTAYWNSK